MHNPSIEITTAVIEREIETKTRAFDEAQARRNSADEIVRSSDSEIMRLFEEINNLRHALYILDPSKKPIKADA